MAREEPTPVDPITDVCHYEVPDLTEWELHMVLEGLGALEQSSGVKKLVEKVGHSECKAGHPRPLASLPWEKARERGCSDADLIFDLGGRGE